MAVYLAEGEGNSPPPTTDREKMISLPTKPLEMACFTAILHRSIVAPPQDEAALHRGEGGNQTLVVSMTYTLICALFTLPWACTSAQGVLFSSDGEEPAE